MAWASGQKLQDGKYIIKKELGLGGFGITYLARDNNGQQVVIKTLNHKVQRRADFAKFQQDSLLTGEVPTLNRKEVLDRCLIAYQLFKDWHYGILGWNCEHFARLVTTGEAVSYQVKESPLACLNPKGYHALAKEMMDKACQLL